MNAYACCGHLPTDSFLRCIKNKWKLRASLWKHTRTENTFHAYFRAERTQQDPTILSNNLLFAAIFMLHKRSWTEAERPALKHVKMRCYWWVDDGVTEASGHRWNRHSLQAHFPTDSHNYGNFVHTYIYIKTQYCCTELRADGVLHGVCNVKTISRNWKSSGQLRLFTCL
jgi:hypothetical protein